MSGISFKITAPARPNSSASNAAPSSRPPQSRSTSRHQSHRNEASEEGSEDDDAFRRASGRDNKRRRVGGEEEVVEFGKDGATSKHSKPTPAAPLVIPALPNKDWRKAAEELRAGRKPGKKREMYLPEKGGGMRMREGKATPISEAEVDAINTQEVVGGLEKMEKKVKMELDEQPSNEPRIQPQDEMPPPPIPVKTEESEERRALRELLGEGASSGEAEEVALEAIYSAADARNGPIAEDDAFKRDVDSRPDEASLDDYARVPVGAFGLAMLRGMGWQPGQAASRSGRGAIEAHVPSSRPSLLGIGAKPMAEAMGDDGKKGAKGKNGPGGKSRREEMKFVPLVKQAREGSTSGRSTPLPITDGSASSSRRPSRSPPPSSSSSRRDRDRSPRRERDRDERRSSRYDDDNDRRSRREDERKSSRNDEERRGSSRRDDGDRRRESDRDDRRRRDEKDSYRDDRRRREERDGYRDRKGDRDRG